MIRVIVAGQPAPQGSKRHVGGGRMIEQSKAVAPWREAVRAETQRAMNGAYPFEGPVQVWVTFRLARPKGHYRTGRNSHLLSVLAPDWPARQPDLDKLCRAVLDGLTAGGAWLDDAQVVSLNALKEFGEPAGCLIEIERMERS